MIQNCSLNIDVNDFNFRQVYWKEVKFEILNLNIKKSFNKGSIPTAITKPCLNIYFLF